MNNVGNKLSEYRLKHKRSQLEIADALGVTQVQISRIESGKSNPSRALLSKIASLLGESIRETDFELHKEREREWSISYFVMANSFSGDRVVINKKLPEKICIIHVDSEGHNSAAIHSSNCLEIAFEAIVSSSLSSDVATASHILRSLDKTAKNLRTQWKVPSSCAVFTLNKSHGLATLVNAGMPSTFHFNASTKKITQQDGINKTNPAGAISNSDLVADYTIPMNKGDILASFSDGFLEFFKRVVDTEISDYLSAIAKSLRGDAEGIGSKLLKELALNENKISASDDLSFVVLGKN